ncbi:MAG: peptidylprolyl isomerase [archaeon]
MKLKSKDFIEIEFTGQIKNGEIFDSNIKEELAKINPNAKAKPFVFCLEEDMFIQGVDEFLIGKEPGEYKIELTPEKAFGKRDSKLVQMIPMKFFVQHKLNPFPGAVFNFDNKMGKVLSVSTGRVLVDFNNPLAGKDIIYNVKVKKKIENTDEKVKALNEFFFRRDFKFKIKDKKLFLEADKGFKQFVELFKDKYKDILNLELDVKEVGEKETKKDDKTPQQSL